MIDSGLPNGITVVDFDGRCAVCACVLCGVLCVVCCVLCVACVCACACVCEYGVWRVCACVMRVLSF